MIRTLLVANRGEIASRIFRTCRSMGIRTVAVYAEPDRTLPFVREADVAIALGGSSSSESYLVIDKILAAAQASGADAVHPGFGFLSENAVFAQAVLDAGLTWVGPTPANITAMGTKVEAKQLAGAAGVPILPSEVARGDDPLEWSKAADEVGYPMLVKASSGGGGRGMRIVLRADDLAEAITGARREAASSFGDSTVFMERYVPAPRHIEFQIFGDTHGNLIHLGERECSIQRRHQKIVEESPSVALSPSQRDAMAAAAVNLARAIDYVGAGTVEFLFDRGEFWFLEMNTRLQVEHPVTECVTGFDLVQWQIDVANGGALPVSQEQVVHRGHAIEVRLYAEHPAEDFAPTFGHLHTYAVRPGDRARFEHGVESGSEVTTFFDPMIAKVITHAPTREQAASQLVASLRGMSIHGVMVNRDYLADILEHSDFLAGDTTTRFVEDHPALVRTTMNDHDANAHLIALTLVHSLRRRRANKRWGFARTGWRNMGNPYHRVEFDSEQCGHPFIAYRWWAEDHAMVGINGGDWDTRILRSDQIDKHTDEITIDVEGRTSTVRVTVIGHESWCNSSAGQTAWTDVPRFPISAVASASGGPIAPVPGRVVAIAVAVGQHVEAGQTLVTMEAMKMEHRIEAPNAGTVIEIRCEMGAQVDAHQLLIVLE